MTGPTKTTTTADAVRRGTAAPTAEPHVEFLDIELTERCNLRCPHCYIRRAANDTQALSSELPASWYSEVLKEAVRYGCQGVRFTGGEALIRGDFAEIYLCAHALGLQVSFSTNATLITEKILDTLGRFNPQDITTSIYGWDSRSYDDYVGIEGAFTRFLSGLKRLRDRRLPFKTQYPPVQPLVDNSDRIRELAASLGVTEPLPYAWELTMHARNDPAACERLRSLRLTPEQAARERLKEPHVAVHDVQNIRYGGRRPPFDGRLFACRAARRRLTIDAFGRLQVCLEMRHPDTLYDLRKGSLAEALWQHVPKVREWLATDADYFLRCGSCVLQPACPQCSACSWMEYGTRTFTPVEYYCQVMHAEARMLGLLHDDEKGWEVAPLRSGEHSPLPSMHTPEICRPWEGMGVPRGRRPPPSAAATLPAAANRVTRVGQGSPPFLIEVGIACVAAEWSRVAASLSNCCSVFTYDRSGYSPCVPQLQKPTISHIVQGLRQLVAETAIPVPAVLVGHSFGGLIVQYLAMRYPDEVAGLVLVESNTVDDSTMDQWDLPEVSLKELRRLEELATDDIRVLIAGGVRRKCWSLRPEKSEEVIGSKCRPAFWRAARREISVVRESIEELKSVLTALTIPVTVVCHSHGLAVEETVRRGHLSRSEAAALEDAFTALQKSLLSLTTGPTELVVAETASHHIHLAMPEVVVQAAIRTWRRANSR